MNYDYKFRESDLLFSSLELSIFLAGIVSRPNAVNSEPQKLSTRGNKSSRLQENAQRGRPPERDWDSIVDEYVDLKFPSIKPFCRKVGIAPKLLRYHLKKRNLRKPNL
jgi:hypothetical protein